MKLSEADGNAKAFSMCPTYNEVHSNERLNLGDKVSVILIGRRISSGTEQNLIKSAVGLLITPDKLQIEFILNNYKLFYEHQASKALRLRL